MALKPLLLLTTITLTIHFTTYTNIVLADPPPSEKSALLSLRHAVGGRTLLWNISASPCTWAGVFCSKSGSNVIELHLPGMGLLGQLPIGLSNISNLQTLSLRFNTLSGSIPPDVGSLSGSLRNLYLQENYFSGDIPEFLFGLTNLVRLNLGHNNFSGMVSKDFGKLTRLRTLFLQENQLSGIIPDLDLSVDLFNVSYNNLSGGIPMWVSGMPSSSFEGNSLCGGPLVACRKSKNHLSGGAIAGIVIGCFIGLVLVSMVLLCCFRRRAKAGSRYVQEKDEGDVEISHDRGVSGGEGTNVGVLGGGKHDGGESKMVFFGNVERKYDLEDLLRASAEVLGKGTFGTAYKATMDTGVVAAVKRLKDVNVAEKEFREKVEAFGRMNHENLVPLRAYFYSREEKLLVYEYLPTGSLSALLHGNRGLSRTPLNWETRSRIALGAARGIAYIHSQGSASSHGNLKSSNILLSPSYDARVSDFSLAHLAAPTTTPNRVDGYRAPEVTDTRKVSQKADVYSFGVVLLELLTAKPPTHSLNNDDGVDLPRWVQSVVREDWTAEVFDIELLRYQNIEEEMVQLLQLAVDCTAQYPDSRPSMVFVETRIKEMCSKGLQREQAVDNENDIIDDKAL